MDKNAVINEMNEQRSNWSSIGTALIALGLMAVAGGFFFDPSVEVSSGIYELDQNRVINFQSLATQLMILGSGLTICLGGLFCHGIGAIIRAHRASIALLVQGSDAIDEAIGRTEVAPNPNTQNN